MTDAIINTANEPIAEVSENEQLPTPFKINWNAVFLGGLFALAVLAVCYLAAEIILPIVLACIFNLVLQPSMRQLQRIYIPRMVAALMMVAALLTLLVGLGAMLSVPASNWAHRLPTDSPQIQEKITLLKRPIDTVQKFLHRAEGFTKTDDPKTTVVAVESAGLSTRLLTGTQNFVSSLFETLLILFFMLISGDKFLRRFVEILPRFSDKKQAIEITQQIERDISAYLATITIMNALVGLATTLIMWGCGIEDPILWGTIAFLLNYVPIIGPVLALISFAGVGLLSINNLGLGLLPAGLYFIVHLIEGETVTPLLLARRFTINPVLVILSLIFWYWMWGVTGAILSTPMLAIFKIICDRVDNLKPLGHVIEG